MIPSFSYAQIRIDNNYDKKEKPELVKIYSGLWDIGEIVSDILERK